MPENGVRQSVNKAIKPKNFAITPENNAIMSETDARNFHFHVGFTSYGFNCIYFPLSLHAKDMLMEFEYRIFLPALLKCQKIC